MDMNTLIGFGLQLSKSETAGEFKTALESACDYVGASIYNALAFDSDAVGTSAPGVSNASEDCFDAIDAAVQTGRNDPVMQHCRLHSTPMAWNEKTYVRAGKADAWEVMAAYGARRGVSLALHIEPRRHFFLSLDWSSSTPDRLVPAEECLALQTLTVFGEAAAFRIWQAPRPMPNELPQKLTARELECLNWVCRGMTDDLIARILDLSARTVRKHVESCIRKLSACNRTEAAVIATQLGLTSRSWARAHSMAGTNA